MSKLMAAVPVIAFSAFCSSSVLADTLSTVQASVREGTGDSAYYAPVSKIKGYTMNMSGGVQYSGLSGFNRPARGHTASNLSHFKRLIFQLNDANALPNFTIVVQDSATGYYYVSSGTSGSVTSGGVFFSAAFKKADTGWTPSPTSDSNSIGKIAVVYSGGTDATTSTLTESQMRMRYNNGSSVFRSWQSGGDSFKVPSGSTGYDTKFNFEP